MGLEIVRGLEERNWKAVENPLFTLTTQHPYKEIKWAIGKPKLYGNSTCFYKEFCKNFQRQKYAIMKIS